MIQHAGVSRHPGVHGHRHATHTRGHGQVRFSTTIRLGNDSNQIVECYKARTPESSIAQHALSQLRNLVVSSSILSQPTRVTTQEDKSQTILSARQHCGTCILQSIITCTSLLQANLSHTGCFLWVKQSQCSRPRRLLCTAVNISAQALQCMLLGAELLCPDLSELYIQALHVKPSTDAPNSATSHCKEAKVYSICYLVLSKLPSIKLLVLQIRQGESKNCS